MNRHKTRDLLCRRGPLKRRIAATIAAAATLVCQPAFAESEYFTFASTSFLFLYGDGFELGDDERTIITAEHANAWRYGDNFFFVDVTNPTRNSTETPTEFYAEFSPRLSLGKITGAKVGLGFITDVLLAGTLETGEGFHNYLYGLGVDLAVPGFNYVSVNGYRRDNRSPGAEDGWQVTLVWGTDFQLGPLPLVFEGYLDYAFEQDPDQKDYVLVDPRLLIDVGALFGRDAGKFQVGVEYRYWNRKFGIGGVEESLPQAAMKWTF
jgi:nucleoside-specific outer membrane channel protein Tsx